MIYCFKCPNCGKRTSVQRPVASHADPPPPCACGTPPIRDFQTEHAAGPRPANWPQWSENLGVAPNQVGDFRKAYPDVEINQQGQVRVDSLSDHRRILKRLRMFDKSAYS